MRRYFYLAVVLLVGVRTQAASTLVWVESQEAATTALTEELQALAGPTDLLRLLTGRQMQSDIAGQAIIAARLAWRQVQLESLTATLDQAERALLAKPKRGDAARLAEVFAYRAGVQVMNFQADSAKEMLTAAAGLGLQALPGDLTNTLGELWGQISAEAKSPIEIGIRVAPGARLWVDDAPWDRPTSPSVVPGLHLIGATQNGHVPVWQWLSVSPTATRATLLPQAAAQLAPVSSQLGAGARGDRSQADAVRRGLGVDGLVLCTMTLVAARYDARCTLHTGIGEPRSAVASFLPGEPLGAHAQRIWQGLSAPMEVTIKPGDLGADRAQAGTALAWTTIALGSSSLLVSGWSALQTRAVHQQLRETLGHEASVPNLQTSGKEYALIADATLATGLLLNVTGAYLLHKARVKNAAIEQLAGGQP